MESQQQYLETTLARLLDWIRAADIKIAPILAIDTTMLGVFAALAPKHQRWTILAAIVAVLAVIPLLVSLFFLFFAAFPRTKGPKGSLLYFEGIKSREPNDFLKAVQEMSKGQLIEDLANQCHRNAEIASAKYAHLRTAIGALFLSVIPWLFLVFLLYRA